MTDSLWYEDDRFWDTIGPALFGDSRVKMASKEVDALLSLTNVRPPVGVLDLCCGMGRHSLEFARRGLTVTGVDRTAGYIEQAKRNAAGEGLDVEFVQADMREYSRVREFDLVVCLYTSFGYFPDPADDRKAVDNVFRSLRQGGVFIIDVMGRETLKRVFHPRAWREEDGVIVLEDGKVSENWDRIDNHWIIMKGDDRSEVKFTLRVYSADELSGLLEGCGLEVTGTYGWFDGSPYDDNALRLVIKSRKP